MRIIQMIEYENNRVVTSQMGSMDKNQGIK